MATFNPELDTLFSDLGEGYYFCWPKEMTSVNTYGAIGMLENGGLIGFWSNDLKQEKIIRDFRKIGARQFAGVLEDSRETWELVKDLGFDEMNKVLEEKRFEEFSKLETQVFERCEQVMGLVQVFVERNRIEARPPGVIKKVVGLTWKLGGGIAYMGSFFLPRSRDVSPKRTESVRKPSAS